MPTFFQIQQNREDFDSLVQERDLTLKRAHMENDDLPSTEISMVQRRRDLLCMRMMWRE